MNRKGAIELSANFIVIIVISSVILIGGLALFYGMRDDVTNYAKSIDTQTADRIKSMMLGNGARVAVFPRELTLSPGDAEAVGIGVTNIEGGTDFEIVVTVKYYSSSDSDSAPVQNEQGFYSILEPTFTVPVGNQVVKSVLLKIPKEVRNKGQYVYTLKVMQSGVKYDAVQVFVNV